MHIDPHSIYNFDVPIPNWMCIAPTKAHGFTITYPIGGFIAGFALVTPLKNGDTDKKLGGSP